MVSNQREMATRNWLVVLALALIGLCVFVGWSAYKARIDAGEALNAFRELGTSKDPTASFELLRRKYGSKLHAIGCEQQLCQYEMSLSNASISRLYVVPYTEMNVWFTMYNGSLQVAMLEYRTALKAKNSPVVHVQQDVDPCCGVSFDVNPHGTTQQMWNGLVEISAKATPEQRDAALALNLECLTRIGGCRDIIDLLPTLWKHTGPGTISSRLAGLSQALEESHGLPSPNNY